MNARPLATIAAEIATLLKRETKHVIKIGELLAEAQEQLDENEQWLLWLRDNFSLSSALPKGIWRPMRSLSNTTQCRMYHLRSVGFTR
jgi:hypothetical protein